MKIIQKNFKLLGRTKARWWRKPSACTKSQHRKMRSQIDFIFLLAFSPLRGSSSAPPVIFKLLILHLFPHCHDFPTLSPPIYITNFPTLSQSHFYFKLSNIVTLRFCIKNFLPTPHLPHLT